MKTSVKITFLIFCSLLLIPGSAWAQIPTQTPESSTTPDNIRYSDPRIQLKLQACVARVAAFKNKPCDIIFIGDSITEFWSNHGKAIWDKSYAPRNALNFGIGGDKTQNVLWRLDNLDITNLKPKVAVILIGTNNGSDTPQGVADGVKAVISKTQQLFSGVKIILVSITPCRRYEKTMAVDAIIKGYADDKSIYYLDLVPLMTPIVTTTPDGKQDTNYKGLNPDHLHPSAEGYQLWADAMEPLLSKLLTQP